MISKEQQDKLMCWMRTEEGMKQNKLNSKPCRKERENPQKHKDNNKSGSRNWKSKFRKAIKIDQGLKSIM